MGAAKTAASFTPKSASRIAAVVKIVEAEHEPTDTGGAYSKHNPYKSEIWVKLGDTPTLVGTIWQYAWTQQRLKPDGTWEDYPSGLTGTTTTDFALDTNNATANGTPIVRLYITYVWDTNWTRKYVFVSGGGKHDFIPVSLSTDAGSDGTASTAPTYTYKWPVNLVTGNEIKMADGTTRATGLAPTWDRNIGEFNHATHGTVYIGSDGNPVLFQADETEKICDPEGVSGTFTTVTVVDGIVVSGS